MYDVKTPLNKHSVRKSSINSLLSVEKSEKYEIGDPVGCPDLHGFLVFFFPGAGVGTGATGVTGSPFQPLVL